MSGCSASQISATDQSSTQSSSSYNAMKSSSSFSIEPCTSSPSAVKINPSIFLRATVSRSASSCTARLASACSLASFSLPRSALRHLWLRFCRLCSLNAFQRLRSASGLIALQRVATSLLKRFARVEIHWPIPYGMSPVKVWYERDLCELVR
ncbi:hypothetical protein FH972_023615 [Carpinus fangiana]|uniref:Uncharacterized protein n=1 Tax=Carpinus fangiana TaxID=176857 RepID=A0A5N6KVP6_9ROSI|nr:hypothetical protein FH972_023615 [Carpinus fangiana]